MDIKNLKIELIINEYLYDKSIITYEEFSKIKDDIEKELSQYGCL